MESDRLKKNGVREFKSVKIIDIQPDTRLAFDTYVFLPTNNKYVIFSRASEALKVELFERLRANKVSSIFVPLDQMPKFYEYTTTVLKNLRTSDSEISETERQQRLYEAVRNLLSDAIRDSQKNGEYSEVKDLFADCSKIVETYILSTSSKSIYHRILAIIGEYPDNYSHSANTSTFAALFSMGLNLGNPEYLAVAGLLHDLGLASVPIEIQKKQEKDRTPAEQEIYQRHVSATLDMIKAQKLILPDLVLKAILQHHERLNATGYPSGLPGAKVSSESQILSIADRFDELTCLEAGKARLTPKEAIEFLSKEVHGDQKSFWYDPTLMGKVLGLFNDDI